MAKPCDGFAAMRTGRLAAGIAGALLALGAAWAAEVVTMFQPARP